LANAPGDLVTITIDGAEQSVPRGQLLIKAAEDCGTYIPRFCWHPRMKPVGMCRMCLVEVETPRGKLLTTSCTMSVTDGLIVETASDVAVKAQEGVLEFLLINHPLDCPICDKGGECPLQDQTLAYGPGESRYVEPKRHFEKPIEISDLVLLDRERCILCARCTRFSSEVSGDPLIEFAERGTVTQVLTFPDEPFASYFSGNTVEICPVGALTAKPYRFRARPWDLEAVESVSLVDSVGSKVTVQSSQNEIVRIDGVDNDPTNQGWLSDKDRFIFEYVNSPHRLTSPLIKQDGEFREASWSEALDLVADRLGAMVGTAIAGLGGARSTNEEAFTFGKFLRTVVVTPHVDAQLADGLDPQFLSTATPRAVIDDLDRGGTILVWSGDLKEELPVLYLRVRGAATTFDSQVIVIHPRRTGLDDVAAHKITYRPGSGPDVLRKLIKGDGDYADARASLDVGPVVAIVGRTGLTEGPRLAEAVAAFARDLPGGKIMPIARRGNLYGALDMGLAPTLFPGRVAASSVEGRSRLEASWGPLSESTGRSARGILEGLEEGTITGLILLGSDPVRDFPDPGLAVRALEGAAFMVSFDIFLSDSSQYADVVLPMESFGEVEGTVTNLEGRVQKVNRKVAGPGQTRPSWAVLDDLAQRMGGQLGARSAQAVSKEIATVAPAYHGVYWDLVDWGEGRQGLVLPLEGGEQPLQYVPVDPALRSRSSAGLSLHLGRVLYDDGVQTRMSPSLARLMPHAAVHLHPLDARALGVEEGQRVEVRTDVGDAELEVTFDETIARRTAYVPANLPETAMLGASPGVTVERLGGENA
jgi:NADH-quinone oxidoreductase subunit G